ncbi:hypothetical protein AB5I41_28000 [Sphingomonas sp. MMS24-JH45]
MTRLYTIASGAVNGTDTVKTGTVIGGSGFSSTSALHGEAFATGNPNSTATGAFFKYAAPIKAAFGSTPIVVGQIGGAHTAAGSDSQMTQSRVSMSVDLTKMATQGNLIVGFDSGKLIGGGFDTLQLYVGVENRQVLNMTFTSAADALAFFNDHAIDLGALTTLVPDKVLDLDIVLYVTSKTAGGGFETAFIVGHPPAQGASHLGEVGVHDQGDTAWFDMDQAHFAYAYPVGSGDLLA